MDPICKISGLKCIYCQPGACESREQHKNLTNYEVCCQDIETMAQVIDIAKVGWTKEQILNWLNQEAHID